ncbi:hypothetical protein Ddye_022135 [Dipteronia dyeriana]|uniref:RING-type E3 ubiquitin transferase n=1 Tax=Dipteronia dyeriana TaxID=168575 RepID=A0AAD9U2Y0_9ROSI|nr:hypothetical protein Ddye_022135 [Dipteronia dyeriana]
MANLTASSSSSPASSLLFENQVVLALPPPLSSSSSSSPGADDDTADDACSICLEPFSTQDPPTVTSCNHGYHLQCILEWAQRSKECPICWQQFVLKDPASQELLAAVGGERRPKSRNTVSPSPIAHLLLPEDFDYERALAYWDSLEREERILQHMTNARYFRRRERQRASGLDPSQVHVFTSPANDPEMLATNTCPSNFSHGLSEGDSSTSHIQSAVDDVQPLSSVPSIAVNRDDPFKPRVHLGQLPPDSPRRPSPSEFLSFSDSIKSKWSAASSRYKESFSKSTRGLKEKLVARNNSVKELSREVQREMSAGIAGVAKMIERLDLASKRSGASVPGSGCSGGTSGILFKGKGVQETTVNKRTGEVASPYVSDNNPGRLEELHAQQREL